MMVSGIGLDNFITWNKMDYKILSIGRTIKQSYQLLQKIYYILSVKLITNFVFFIYFRKYNCHLKQ